MNANRMLLSLAGILCVACGSTAPGKSDVLTRTRVEEVYIRGVPLERTRALGWDAAEIAKYEASSKRFPNVESCLSSGSRRASRLQIDWYKIGSDEDAEICVARVARAIGTVSQIETWLKSQGFTVNYSRKTYDEFGPNAVEQDGIIIDAGWPIARNGPLYRRGLVVPVLQRIFGYNVSTLIFVGVSGKVYSATVTTNTL